MELSPSGQPIDKKPILSADGKILTDNDQTSSNTGALQGAIGVRSGGQLTVDELHIEILPVIYDIIRCIEKDPLDNTSKQRESQECSQKILELQKRFDSARAQIKQLRGIEFNKDEQLQNLEILRNQLKLKQDLIRKYKDLKF